MLRSRNENAPGGIYWSCRPWGRYENGQSTLRLGLEFGKVVTKKFSNLETCVEIGTSFCSGPLMISSVICVVDPKGIFFSFRSGFSNVSYKVVSASLWQFLGFQNSDSADVSTCLVLAVSPMSVPFSSTWIKSIPGIRVGTVGPFEYLYCF
jgi:hypothetical protein